MGGSLLGRSRLVEGRGVTTSSEWRPLCPRWAVLFADKVLYYYPHMGWWRCSFMHCTCVLAVKDSHGHLCWHNFGGSVRYCTARRSGPLVLKYTCYIYVFTTLLHLLLCKQWPKPRSVCDTILGYISIILGGRFLFLLSGYCYLGIWYLTYIERYNLLILFSFVGTKIFWRMSSPCVTWCCSCM